MYYIVRIWFWILVVLVFMVIYFNLEDKELGYFKLMIDFLFLGILGLVVVFLVVVFMSIIFIFINWGVFFIINDLY